MTDNISNNKKYIKKLNKFLNKQKGVLWNPKENHMSCLNHVLNIAIQIFLWKGKVLNIENYVFSLSLFSLLNGEDKDLSNYEDDLENKMEDEYDLEQEDTPEIDEEIKEATDGFQRTIWKLWEYRKVYFL